MESNSDSCNTNDSAISISSNNSITSTSSTTTTPQQRQQQYDMQKPLAYFLKQLYILVDSQNPAHFDFPNPLPTLMFSKISHNYVTKPFIIYLDNAVDVDRFVPHMKRFCEIEHMGVTGWHVLPYKGRIVSFWNFPKSHLRLNVEYQNYIIDEQQMRIMEDQQQRQQQQQQQQGGGHHHVTNNRLFYMDPIVCPPLKEKAELDVHLQTIKTILITKYNCEEQIDIEEIWTNISLRHRICSACNPEFFAAVYHLWVDIVMCIMKRYKFLMLVEQRPAMYQAIPPPQNRHMERLLEVLRNRVKEMHKQMMLMLRKKRTK